MSGWTYSFENVEKKSKMQKAKRGVFAYFGMDPVMGMTKSGTADLMDMSAWPPAASEAEFWTFSKNNFVHFQDLLLVFQAVFNQWHVHNRALDANGEAAFPVSQGGSCCPPPPPAAVRRHHRLQDQHGGGR